MKVYILEMMITSPDRVVTEPLGVYDTMRKAKINLKGLRKELSAKAFPALKAAAIPRIERKFKQETARLLDAFENHEITKEIEAGPGASNSSGTLGGYGNLFTFIGFDRGQDPISPIRSLLARSIKIVSIRNIVQLICKLMNKKFLSVTISRKDRRGKDKIYKLSSKQTEKNLKWNPKITLEKGINHMIDFTAQNYKSLLKYPLIYKN